MPLVHTRNKSLSVLPWFIRNIPPKLSVPLLAQPLMFVCNNHAQTKQWNTCPLHSCRDRNGCGPNAAADLLLATGRVTPSNGKGERERQVKRTEGKRKASVKVHCANSYIHTCICTCMCTVHTRMNSD